LLVVIAITICNSCSPDKQTQKVNTNDNTTSTPEPTTTPADTSTTTNAQPVEPTPSTIPNTTSGTYKIGNTGPAGGLIFYDKGDYVSGWRYLEAAPANSEETAQWGLYGIACLGTSDGIGSGKANTDIINNLLLTNGETNCASQLCVALNINGFNDWFLPSKDELNLMYENLRVGENIGRFNINGEWTEGWYWSSSVVYYENDEPWYSGYFTWIQRFSDGYQGSAHNGKRVLVS